MKPLCGLLMTSVVLLFTGCLEISEEIWFNNDGSGRIRYDFLIAEKFLGSSTPGKSQAFVRGLKRRLEKRPEVRKFSVREYKDTGLHHYLVDIDVRHAGDIGAILNELSGEQSALVGDTASFEEVTLGSSGEGRFSFRQPFGRALNTSLASTMFAGRFLTVTIHAPKFLSTNGTLDSLSGRAEWKIPLGDTAAVRTSPNEIRAEIQLHKRTHLLLYAGIAASAAFIIGLIWNLLHKKR